MSGYWQNTLSNQPGGSLYMTTWGSKSSCESAQAATGSIVYPDQCRYVDTTPVPVIQELSINPLSDVKSIPKETLILGAIVLFLLFMLRR